MHSQVQFGTKTAWVRRFPWNSYSLNVYSNKRSMSANWRNKKQNTGTVTRLKYTSISENQNENCVRRERRESRRDRARDRGNRTLSHEVPPRRVQLIVQAPPTDILAICRTRVILIYILGAKRCLPVKPGERIDVTPPPASCRRSTFTSLWGTENWGLHVGIQYVERLIEANGLSESLA